MGCVPPVSGFLAGLRELCSRHGALLIFDEVMTGFRVARGGAAERYAVTPDLITLGKVAGGGLPLAAFGGRRDLMQMVAPAGPVYQAGTYAAHPLAVAAGLATFDVIDASPDLLRAPRAHRGAARVVAARRPGVGGNPRQGAARRLDVDPVLLEDAGPVVGRRGSGQSRGLRAILPPGMIGRGVLLPPSPFESAFVSAAHDDATVTHTIDAARATFTEMAQ